VNLIQNPTFQVDPPVLQIKRHDTGEVVGAEVIGRLQAEDEDAQEEGAAENNDDAGPSVQERPAKRLRTLESVKKEILIKSEGKALLTRSVRPKVGTTKSQRDADLL
jgi:hypothetical protein